MTTCEPSLPSKHEVHIAGKGFTWKTHYNLAHKFIPVPLAMKIPDAKAAVDKEWKNLETIPVRQLEKVKSKKEVILEAQRDKRKVHSATLMVTCLLSVPKDCCKSNGCYCKTTRLWRTSSWCSICLHSIKIGGRSQIARNSRVRMSRHMDTSSATQMAEILGTHWRPSGTPWKNLFWTPIERIIVGKTI